jgi:glutamyl/glutaminyl-tRNA synthetase
MRLVNVICRNADVETNLKNYALMHSGQAGGENWCLRAKCDMNNDNGTLRDPVLYRANYVDPHVRTGTKYRAYPTYDFACPIVDSIEGVTHAMRTTEYNDRAAQYFWIIEALRLRPVHLQEFARMNFQYALMSKRKLQQLVDNKSVQGWDDPRFPTIQGTLRRGVTVQCLKDFVVSQGFSKRIVDMEWDKFWSVNNKIIDPDAERYMAIFKDNAIVMTISNLPKECPGIISAKHPKNPALGNKVILTGPAVYLEREDMEGIAVGDEVCLMRWGVMKITEVTKDSNGVIQGISSAYVPNGDFKKKETRKLCWVLKSNDAVEVNLVEFDHLINKAKLEESDDWTKFLNKVSKVEAPAIGDSALRNLKVNQVIQLERRGFYRVDSAYVSADKPLMLFMIPDGKKKAMSTLSFKLGHH